MKEEYKYNVDFVALHITQVCSHRCPFCYSANDNVKPKHPSLSKLKLVVGELSKSKVKEICFLGGDPASYPFAVDLARYTAEKGITVSILSNTLSFPNSSLEEAAKYFTAFETTIHHWEPEQHDKFCKSSGAYERLIKRLKKCAEYGRKTGIAVNIVPETPDKIFDIVDKVVDIEKVPLDYIIVQRIVPFGRAKNTSQFTLSRKQVEKAFRSVKRVSKELGLKLLIEDPVPICILPPDLRKYITPCQWGINKASIDPNGNLSRCGADPRYRIGNIFETPLLKIWNESETLKSFRSKKYLPGRCQVCPDLTRCGGGCPLSCEIDKDHGIDYLYSEYEEIDKKIHGELVFDNARESELSSILQIEWGNFAGYGHVFSVESLKKWYAQNPKMFWVVRDARKWILGYATLVPITRNLYNSIIKGNYSSLTHLPEEEVLTTGETEYFHIEVLATISSRTSSRTGIFLIRSIGNFLLDHAKYVTTSPITNIGRRLCKYFGFKHASDENFEGRLYPVYYSNVKKEEIQNKLKRF